MASSYQCRFCKKSSPVKEWDRMNHHIWIFCPECGRKHSRPVVCLREALGGKSIYCAKAGCKRCAE